MSRRQNNGEGLQIEDVGHTELTDYANSFKLFKLLTCRQVNLKTSLLGTGRLRTSAVEGEDRFRAASAPPFISCDRLCVPFFFAPFSLVKATLRNEKAIHCGVGIAINFPVNSANGNYFERPCPEIRKWLPRRQSIDRNY